MKPKKTRPALARLARKLAQRDPVAAAGAESRRARGLRLIGEITGVEGTETLNGLVDHAPGLTRDIVDFAYGDVISEGRLDARTRALVVVAALAAIGHARPQLRVHIGSALNGGCTREEIVETLRLVALYAGFPAAMNGMAAAQEAFAAKAPPSSAPAAPRGRTRPP